MNTLSQREPLITVGTIGSLITSLVVLLRSFGVPLTDDQSNAINQFMAIAAPILIALIGRQFVYSPNTVKTIADTQYDAGVPPTEPQPEIPGPADRDPAFDPDEPGDPDAWPSPPIRPVR